MLISMIGKMVKEQNIDSVILGCTEFPLILPEDDYAGVPVLNTTSIHVREIVSYCLDE
jgi:aspartate racemase